jgi:hypothetical protein
MMHKPVETMAEETIHVDNAAVSTAAQAQATTGATGDKVAAVDTEDTTKAAAAAEEAAAAMDLEPSAWLL